MMRAVRRRVNCGVQRRKEAPVLAVDGTLSKGTGVERPVCCHCAAGKSSVIASASSTRDISSEVKRPARDFNRLLSIDRI